MRLALLLGLLTACSGGLKDSDQPAQSAARNGLHPTFEGEDVDTLQLRVTEVRFRAEEGPTGSEHDISTFEVAVLDATHQVDGPILDLAAGRYDDAAVLVTLDSGDGVDALTATGVTDDIAWTLLVTDPVTLRAEQSVFRLGGGPDVMVSWELPAGDWLEGLELEDLAQNDEVVVARGMRGYEQVLQAITDTEGRFPGELESEDGD